MSPTPVPFDLERILTSQGLLEKVDGGGAGHGVQALERLFGSEGQSTDVLSRSPRGDVVVFLHGRRSEDVEDQAKLMVAAGRGTPISPPFAFGKKGMSSLTSPFRGKEAFH